MYKYQVYQPQYYKNFKCIGNECKNNCCHSWVIMIDKPTYDKYMSLDEEVKNEYGKKITIASREPFVAAINMRADKKCQFLNDNMLCDIQARFGHEYLCHTCMAYPRSFCSINGGIEVFLELSCEAAARLALLGQDIMRFESTLLESYNPILCNHVMDAGKYTSAENSSDIFWKLRTVSIAIAQARKYRLQQRLLIIGIFIKQSDVLISSGRDEEVANLADKFLERINTGFYDALVEQSYSAADLEIDFILGILRDLEAKGNASLNKYINHAREGLCITPAGSELPDNIGDNYQRYFELYFADNEYIFENYIVNHIFSDGFPFNYLYVNSIIKNYKELLIKYNLVKFLLVGVSRYHMKFDKMTAVECVSSFSRSFDHHRGGALTIN